MIDYEKLLKKYINHVGTIEGTTFLGKKYRTSEFTDAEWIELIMLSTEK